MGKIFSTLFVAQTITLVVLTAPVEGAAVRSHSISICMLGENSTCVTAVRPSATHEDERNVKVLDALDVVAIGGVTDAHDFGGRHMGALRPWAAGMIEAAKKVLSCP